MIICASIKVLEVPKLKLLTFSACRVCEMACSTSITVDELMRAILYIIFLNDDEMPGGA